MKPVISWKTLLIDGVYVKRVKETDAFCGECGAQRRNYHRLGCSKETSPCGKHQFVIECNCPVREGEEV